MDDQRQAPKAGANEGEGGKSADKRYHEGGTDFANRSDTLQREVEAERDVENYRDEYDRTEKAGKSHSAADLESDISEKNDARR